MTEQPSSDVRFAGPVPEIYDTYMVPLIFQPYADDLVDRLRALGPTSILEVASGSGVVTRAMAAGLPHTTTITATDLSEPMLDRARTVGTQRPVTWRQADVMALPFPDDSFDVVICQFGVMFFPDRPAAFAEVARVLRPGGTFIFNVWDSVAENEFVQVVTDVVRDLFGDDSPSFLIDIPHGYWDRETIEADVVAGGLRPLHFEALEARSRAKRAEIPAIAYCQGTPLRTLIEARGPEMLTRATQAVAAALEARFGARDLDGKIRAFVVTAAAP